MKIILSLIFILIFINISFSQNTTIQNKIKSSRILDFDKLRELKSATQDAKTDDETSLAYDKRIGVLAKKYADYYNGRYFYIDAIIEDVTSAGFIQIEDIDSDDFQINTGYGYKNKKILLKLPGQISKFNKNDKITLKFTLVNRENIHNFLDTGNLYTITIVSEDGNFDIIATISKK